MCARLRRDPDATPTPATRAGGTSAVVATKRAAERALTEIAASVVQGAYVRMSTRTLAEYLRAEWLPATTPPRVRYESWDDRRRNLKNHVIGRIGGVSGSPRSS